VGSLGTRGSRFALSLASVAVLGGCAAGEVTGPTSMPTEINGISLLAELDRETGAVVLPYDRFSLSYEETNVLAAAGSVVVSNCAHDRGVNFVPADYSSDSIYESEDYFGPWTIDQAKRFAFVPPMTDADLAANGITSPAESERGDSVPPNSSLTEADWGVIDDCAATPEMDEYTEALSEQGPWGEPIQAVADSLMDDQRARAVLQDLTGCYDARGLSHASTEEPWLPGGASGSEISEGQIQLAVAVVECKDEVDFTERMADLEASLQAPIIVQYADELSARRQLIDAAVLDARSLLSES
jgi:hypothetical protein